MIPKTKRDTKGFTFTFDISPESRSFIEDIAYRARKKNAEVVKKLLQKFLAEPDWEFIKNCPSQVPRYKDRQLSLTITPQYNNAVDTLKHKLKISKGEFFRRIIFYYWTRRALGGENNEE